MKLNEYIEHTLLKVDCTHKDIIQLMEEAHQYKFYGVCIPPYYVRFANQIRPNKTIKLISVAGFPFGYQDYVVKYQEIESLARLKVDEVDVVINIAATKNDSWTYLQAEWRSLINASKNTNLPIKIIIESGLLNETELTRLCIMANELQPDFIKTSTGFNGEGAELEKVAFLRKHLDDSIQIKASGGIKNAEQALEFISAGATRIGTSSGVQIVSGEEGN